ncbi:hypothetical protein WMY93_018355 [Mugilogobius chulae]|uniref:Uncharacterized protein n=1 Tax=Mugilogobius chulae TaxID=88201 RepID=A0AAW0NQH3_9GOBI
MVLCLVSVVNAHVEIIIPRRAQKGFASPSPQGASDTLQGSSAQVPDGPRASAIWSRFTVLACRCERDTHLLRALKQTATIRHSSRCTRSVGTRPWFRSSGLQTPLHSIQSHPMLCACLKQPLKRTEVLQVSQPASHQVLMRPAGSVLGPNQTGDGIVLAPSALYTPSCITPTPFPPDILENHGRLSTHGTFGNG